MSLPREWSFQESCRSVDRGPTSTSSQEAVGPGVIDENMNQPNQLGSLFSIHSAPVYDLNTGITSPKRPASLVVQTTATSTPLVPPHVSPPDTIEDEDNDNLLTISSLTARPLIAKSREIRSSKHHRSRKKRKPKREPSSPKNPNLVPLDGGYGWIIVFGAFFVQFWVAGLVKSYGVLYVEIMETFSDSSASVASWIPAILSCLCLALAPVTSMLCQKYSCRAVVFIGGLFCALGLTISYFATNLIHLFFTFGILTGIGGGLSTTPGIIIVSQYFDKHRALANGICVSGTAAGSFVFPLLIETLVANFGFHGTILLLGGCMLHVCVSATLYRPLEDNCVVEVSELVSKEKVEAIKESLPTKQQKLDLLFANDTTTRNNLLNELFHQNTVVAVELTDSEEEKDIMGEGLRMKPISKIRSSSILHSVEDLSTDSTCVYKARSSLRSLRSSVPTVVPPVDVQSASDPLPKSLMQRITRYIDLSLLKNPQFIMMCLSVSLMSTGSPYMLYYLPAYVHAAGYTKSEAGYLVAISAALDLCGRLGLGWLSDLKLFDRRKGYIGSIVGAGVAVLAIPMAHSFYVLACSVGMYGLCLGCWFLLVPVLLADQYGTDKISSSYGLVRMFQSVGAISIPPLTVPRCINSRKSFQRQLLSSYVERSQIKGRKNERRRRRGRIRIRKRGGGSHRSLRGIKKRYKVHAGWQHEWTSPNNLGSKGVLGIREIVRGPFSSPRLVTTSPFVLLSSNHRTRDRKGSREKIRRGIPDPWAEYLAFRGLCSKDNERIVQRDLDIGCDSLRVTEIVWKYLGVSFGQGIPDPWKDWPVEREKWLEDSEVFDCCEKWKHFGSGPHQRTTEKCQKDVACSCPSNDLRSFRQVPKSSGTSELDFPHCDTSQGQDRSTRTVLKSRKNEGQTSSQDQTVRKNRKSGTTDDQHSSKIRQKTMGPLRQRRSDSSSLVVNHALEISSIAGLTSCSSRPEEACKKDVTETKGPAKLISTMTSPEICPFNVNEERIVTTHLPPERPIRKPMRKESRTPDQSGRRSHCACDLHTYVPVTIQDRESEPRSNRTKQNQKHKCSNTSDLRICAAIGCSCRQEARPEETKLTHICGRKGHRVSWDATSYVCSKKSPDAVRCHCCKCALQGTTEQPWRTAGPDCYDDCEQLGPKSHPRRMHHQHSIMQSSDVFDKPKKMSRMRRLFNRCQGLHGRPHKKDAASVTVVPGQSKAEMNLVCCRCNCPYLVLAEDNGKDERAICWRENKSRCVACRECECKEKKKKKKKKSAERSRPSKVDVARRRLESSVQYDIPEVSGRLRNVSNSGKTVGREDTRGIVKNVETRKEVRAMVDDDRLRMIRNPREDSEVTCVQARGQLAKSKKKRRERQICKETPQDLTMDRRTNVLPRERQVEHFVWYWSSDSGDNADVSEVSCRYGSIGEPAAETRPVTSMTFMERLNDGVVPKSMTSSRLSRFRSLTKKSQPVEMTCVKSRKLGQNCQRLARRGLEKEEEKISSTCRLASIFVEAKAEGLPEEKCVLRKAVVSTRGIGLKKLNFEERKDEDSSGEVHNLSVENQRSVGLEEGRKLYLKHRRGKRKTKLLWTQDQRTDSNYCVLQGSAN